MSAAIYSGIFAAMFSPADIILAGQWLILPYVIGALPGFIYAIYCAIFQPEFVFWFYLITVGFLPLWSRLYFRLTRKSDQVGSLNDSSAPCGPFFPSAFSGPWVYTLRAWSPSKASMTMNATHIDLILTFRRCIMVTPISKVVVHAAMLQFHFCN